MAAPRKNNPHPKKPEVKQDKAPQPTKDQHTSPSETPKPSTDNPSKPSESSKSNKDQQAATSENNNGDNNQTGTTSENNNDGNQQTNNATGVTAGAGVTTGAAPATGPLEEDAEVVANNITALLVDPDDVHVTKLKTMAVSKDLNYACVSTVLLSHINENQTGGPEHSAEHTIGKLYMIERTITAAAVVVDPVERKAKLGIIETGFLSSGPLGPLSHNHLVRYTELWKWGATALETAKYEVYVFTALSGLVGKVTLPFDDTNSGAINLTLVDPTVMANLKAYFTY